MSPPRHGTRQPFTSVPAHVVAWVGDVLGSPVVDHVERRGGQSPAPAASLTCADGTRAFFKGVAPSINPETPGLFRREIQVLKALAVLPDVPYRPRTLGTYDDGEWVGVLLEDVDGRHPDLTDARDRDVVLDAAVAQSAELHPTPVPGLTARYSDMARTHIASLDRLDEPGVSALVPSWVRERAGELRARLSAQLIGQPDDTLTHLDLRDDNILIRPGGQVVFVDWGSCMNGPRWCEAFTTCVELVETPLGDDVVNRWALDAHGQASVTAALLAFGVHALAKSSEPDPPGMPHIRAFQRHTGERVLLGARRRLDAGLN